MSHEDRDGRLRAYLDDELSPAERAAVDDELDRSRSVRARLEEIRSLGERVDALLGAAVDDVDDVDDVDERAADAREAEVLLDLDRVRANAVGRSFTLRRVLAGVAVLAAAALALLWVATGPSRADEGSRRVAKRQTVQLGDRAIAVAEAGADLRWTIADGGDADVRQRAGAVFYRVEPGGAFEVRTPAGSVTVTGTCFTLEVVPMKDFVTRHGPGAVVGAIAGAALLLTVHEGSVVLANDHGSVEVEAGQSAHARADARPDRGDAAPAVVAGADPDVDAGADRLAELRQRDATQRLRIAALERELAQAAAGAGTAKDGALTEAERVRKCARSAGSPECSTVDPEPAVLEEMARCGTLKNDRPAFIDRKTSDGYAPSKKLASLVDLSDEEVATITRVNEEFTEQWSRDLQGIVADLNDGKAQPIPQGAPPWAIVSSFTSVLGSSALDEESAKIRRQIAQERAGLAPPPENFDALDPYVRYLRLRAGVGDRYEAALGEAIGADRAHELRVAQDGWGMKSVHSGRCPGEAGPDAE